MVRRNMVKAVDARAFRDRGRDGGGPAGHRRDDADGCCGGVDEVGQLCAGDLLPVSDRAHDRADGQAVEVVVHKDEACPAAGWRTARPPGCGCGWRPSGQRRRCRRPCSSGHTMNAQHHQKDRGCPRCWQSDSLDTMPPSSLKKRVVSASSRLPVGVEQCRRSAMPTSSEV